MAIVIDHEPMRDANCLVVWNDTTGHPAYGSYYSYRSHHPAACLALEGFFNPTGGEKPL